MKTYRMLFFLLLFSATLQAQERIEVNPNLPSYRLSFEHSLKRVQQEYLKLPQGQVTRDNMSRFQRDVDHLREIVATVDLGEFGIVDLTKPLDKLDEALLRLPSKENYSEKELIGVRKWSEYLIKEPILHTFLAKNDVVLGTVALDQKHYEEAKVLFQDALDELKLVRASADSRVQQSLSRIDTEIAVLYNAAREQQYLKDKRSKDILHQLKYAFNTYHEVNLHIWNGIEPPFP
jgi:hypothetical protein